MNKESLITEWEFVEGQDNEARIFQVLDYLINLNVDKYEEQSEKTKL